jgi:hypothetical protein
MSHKVEFDESNGIDMGAFNIAYGVVIAADHLVNLHALDKHGITSLWAEGEQVEQQRNTLQAIYQIEVDKLC